MVRQEDAVLVLFRMREVVLRSSLSGNILMMQPSSTWFRDSFRTRCILIELLGELVAAVVVKVGRVDIKDKFAVVGGIRLQAARGNRTSGFQLGE